MRNAVADTEPAVWNPIGRARRDITNRVMSFWAQLGQFGDDFFELDEVPA